MRLVAASSALALALVATRDLMAAASTAECDAAQQMLVQALDAQLINSSVCPGVSDVATATPEDVCFSSGCVAFMASLIDQYPDCSVDDYETKSVLGGLIAACSGGLADDGGSNATSSSSSSSFEGSTGSMDSSAGVGSGDSEGDDGDAGDDGGESPDAGDADSNGGGSEGASGSTGAAASLSASSVLVIALAALTFAM